MLAELHGKVNWDSTLPGDRLEDTLTDAVFSALRYLPRRTVLGAVLRAVQPQVKLSAADLDNAEIILWPAMASGLWPGRNIEPDVVIVAGRHVVVFEAKYHSGFGQYELDGHMLHQLAVQWRAASSWAAARRAISVTVVAITADAAPPASLAEARAQLSLTAKEKFAEDSSRAVQWMPWRSFAEFFRTARDLRPHEEAIRCDVLELMEKRGVSRVFEGFNPEDYWLVTAAQRVAARRLYPSISTFVVELTGLLRQDAIDWGWPQKGMWAPGGLSWIKPQDWVRAWLAASFWPRNWPKRRVANDQIAFYVLFDFINPAVEVGYVQSPANASAISSHWQPHYEALALQLAQIEGSYSVAVE